MKFEDYFTPANRVVASSPRVTPQEQFRENVTKQIQILDGEKPLNYMGKPVAPTITLEPDGTYLVAIKYGGASN